MRFRNTCNAQGIDISNSFADALDDGGSQEAQTMVDRQELAKACPFGMLRLLRYRMPWHSQLDQDMEGDECAGLTTAVLVKNCDYVPDRFDAAPRISLRIWFINAVTTSSYHRSILSGKLLCQTRSEQHEQRFRRTNGNHPTDGLEGNSRARTIRRALSTANKATTITVTFC